MFVVRIIWEGQLVERNVFPNEIDALQYFDDRRAYMVEGEAIQMIEGERILAEYFMAD